MFNIDATFEDTHIMAQSGTGHTYTVNIIDNQSGESREILLSSDCLQMILAFCLHPDGEPVGYEKYYEVLEPIFKDWPNNLRPIP